MMISTAALAASSATSATQPAACRARSARPKCTHGPRPRWLSGTNAAAGCCCKAMAEGGKIDCAQARHRQGGSMRPWRQARTERDGFRDSRGPASQRHMVASWRGVPPS